ncbi:MAG: hypothetical protein M3N91_09220 [Pseudomonadota bacterium]|jgi:hypothetical protein|nr:hypothetical protein [Pseudomonadota bacterium]
MASNRLERRPSPAQPQVLVRDGEGTSIDIQLDKFISADGKHVANIGINLGSAQVPDRKYAADLCAVFSDKGSVKILFGQQRLDGKNLRTAVIVQMTVESASRFLGTLTQAGGPLSEVNRFIAEKYPPEALAKDVAEPQPGQIIALAANLAVVAMSDNEACIDFYQASPFALGLAFKTNKLALEPVVRIDCRSTLFFGMTKGLADLGIKPMELISKGDAS